MSDDTRRLVRALENAEFTGAPAPMAGLITELFDDPDADLQRLSEPALRLLAHATDVEIQPLFHQVLRRTIVTDLQWELFLTRLRRSTPADDRHLPLLVSLAMQAWNNQYIWADDEPVPTGDSPAARVLAASFVSPFRMRQEDRDDPRLAPLIKQQIDEPRIEDEIQRTFEGITVAGDIVSRVARQYEEFPYPRYIAVPRPRPRTVQEYLVDKVGASVPFTDSPRRALIAGTGTGQDALGMAQLFAGCHIVAFDMSARSLAYGVRMAREFGIGNIEFRRASIDDMPAWDQRFDLIEAFGVLHHTPDIESSWRTLLRLLEPGGLMRVGLYGRDERTWLEEIRRRFTPGVDPRSHRALRAARAAILRAGAERIAETIDFYTMSGFRDLLFHEHEASVTREEIEAMIARLGVRLVGFQKPSGSMHRVWVQRLQ